MPLHPYAQVFPHHQDRYYHLILLLDALAAKAVRHLFQHHPVQEVDQMEEEVYLQEQSC